MDQFIIITTVEEIGILDRIPAMWWCAVQTWGFCYVVVCPVAPCVWSWRWQGPLEQLRRALTLYDAMSSPPPVWWIWLGPQSVKSSDVMRGMPYQSPHLQDVSPTPWLPHMWQHPCWILWTWGGALFYVFWVAHRIFEDCTHLVVFWKVSSPSHPCALMVLSKLILVFVVSRVCH